LLSVAALAVGLAMDAFAAAIAAGAGGRRRRRTDALKIGLYFGTFQGVMPVLGWLAAGRFRSVIAGVDHWVAFGLLAFIGGKMIWESRRLQEDRRRPDCLVGHAALLFLAVATSIDALAVGISFRLLGNAILYPALIIGAVAFCFSFLGIQLGRCLGHIFEDRIEVAGGLVLIGIGVKVLVSGL